MDINYTVLISVKNLQNAFNKARRKGTVGSDGVSGRNIKDRDEFINKLREKLLLKSYCPKVPIKLSKLNYDSIKTIQYEILCFEDQVVQFAIRNVINECCKKEFLKTKNVFRNYGEFDEFIALISAEFEECNYYIVDLKDFTSSIDIDKLYEDIYYYCHSNLIIELLDTCLFTYNNKKRGLPLGHILTTFLPHVYMIDIDNQLSNYYRFNDCFVFKFNSANFTFIDQFSNIISQKNLSINKKKTCVLFHPPLDELKQSVVGK